MKSIITISILLCSCITLGQNFNRPTPQDFPSYEFQKYDTSYHNEYLTAPLIGRGKPVLLSILDENGYLLWYKKFNEGGIFQFKYYPNQYLYSYTHTISIDSSYFKIMDTNFIVIDSIQQTNNFLLDNHEFQILPNGNYLISGKSDSIVVILPGCTIFLYQNIVIIICFFE